MKVVTLLLIFAGFILLFLSLKPTQKILKKTPGIGWNLLLFLILSFLAAYTTSFVYILFARDFINAYFAYGVLLAGGGAFVFLVTCYSFNSILEQEYQASHDRMTSLRNRFSFIRSVEQLVDEATPFYIMLIDLTGLKQFNDAFGHSFGDDLLKKVADNFREILPSHCQLYRVGGDEFAILGKESRQPHIENDIVVMQQQFKQPITIRNQKLRIDISIGISIYPHHSKLAHELVQRAEQALYASKGSKGHRYFFSEELHDNAREHLLIANKLHSALESDEFELFYQPLINSCDNSVHGAEVLIRWPQADGSFIPPDKFIPIAEQSTLIHDISCQVIKQAIDDLKVLDKNGFTGCLHINLSAKDLHNDKLLACLKESTSTAQVEPERIVFELTESAMMTDIKQATEIMKQLSVIGYTFSLDDFGTGFSSFPLLRDLPLTQIKIDRSFVMDMDVNEPNRLIVNSMIFLAKSLSFSVVAEGVEDDKVAHMLKVMDCDYLQGYFYSKPLSLGMFLDFQEQNL